METMSNYTEQKNQFIQHFVRMDDASSIGSSLNEYMGTEIQLGNPVSMEKVNHVGNKKICGIRKMWLVAVSSYLLCFTCGLAKSYSAPAVYDMQHRDNSVVKPTEKEVMWIGSIMSLGGVLGSLISGPMADKVGRKDTLIYNLIPHGFGWLIICYAQTVPVLLFGRFMSGIAAGIILCVVPMYCVEISTVEVRGSIGSAFQGFLVTGSLLSVTIGAYISWNYLALNGAVCSILAVMCFTQMPESPRWLLMKNKLPEAVKVMHDLQGGFVNAQKECSAIYEDLRNQPKGRVTLAELARPSSYKPALICLFLFFFHQFTGFDAVIFYSSTIFEVSKDFMDPKKASIILGVTQVLVTVLSNVIVDKAGRKILLTLSACIMGVSFGIFGFYYYELSLDEAFEQNHGWIPLVCVVSAVIGYSIGLGPVPYLLAPELLPVRVRSTLNSVIQFSNGIFSFIVTNTFSDLRHLLKDYGTFWFYSSLSVLAVIYILMVVPETKGKTADEIQDMFDKRRKKTLEHINIAVIS